MGGRLEEATEDPQAWQPLSSGQRICHGGKCGFLVEVTGRGQSLRLSWDGLPQGRESVPRVCT